MLSLSLRQATMEDAEERIPVLSFSMGVVAAESKSLTNWGTCAPHEETGQSDWTEACCTLMEMWVWCSLKNS